MNTDSIKIEAKPSKREGQDQQCLLDCLVHSLGLAQAKWGRFPDHQRVERGKDIFHLGYR